MRFSSPLALATIDGALVLVNEAWSARFGAASLVDAKFDALAAGSADARRLAFQPPDGGGILEASAMAIRTADRVLLMVGDQPASPLQDEVDALRDRVSALEQLAATDHLTGAWNRVHFDRLIDAELARSALEQQPLSLVLLDIDHFKRINDSFGHGVGDSVLRELVSLVVSRTRASDVLFRWGGEEFAVLAASAGYRGAERLAENLCRAVAGHRFETVGTVTVSLGVAERFGDESAEALFNRLDAALYAAKEGGRNRVVVDRRGNSDTWATQSSASPLRLQWHEAYECGDATIDDEHRQLYAQANRLIEAAFHSEAEPQLVRAALDELLAQLRRHFADEEAILARHHYADLEPHKRAHAGLLRRAAYLRERLDTGEATLGAIVEYLAQDVVARHLLVVDRAFFPLFESRSAQSG